MHKEKKGLRIKERESGREGKEKVHIGRERERERGKRETVT
jgi:hypothetical protein